VILGKKDNKHVGIFCADPLSKKDGRNKLLHHRRTTVFGAPAVDDRGVEAQANVTNLVPTRLAPASSLGHLC
jgi:hypothetical protein